MPNQSFNYDRIPSARTVEETLLPEPKEMLGWRNLFMVDNEAQNRDSDTVEYPSLDKDFEDDFVEIKTNDPHPVARLSYAGHTAAWTEYGFKFIIHQTDVEDSKINLVMVNQQEQTKAKMQNLDGIAGATVEANRNSTEIGDNTKSINYSAAVDAEAALMEAGWELSRFMWVMSPQSWGTFAKTEEFSSQTEQFAGELRAEGIQVGELLNHPVLRVNTGPLAGADNTMYLVDTGAYGWESPRRPFSATQGDFDPDERETPYYINGRIDWVPTNPSSAIKVIGGT